MKDYRPYAKQCMKWGLIGCFYIIGPLIYWFYRKKKGKSKKGDFFMFAGSLLAYFFTIYGLILYSLELIKIALAYLYNFLTKRIK